MFYQRETSCGQRQRPVLVECKYSLLLCISVNLSRFLSKTPGQDAHCAQVSGVFFNGLNSGFFLCRDIYIYIAKKIFLYLYFNFIQTL